MARRGGHLSAAHKAAISASLRGRGRANPIRRKVNASRRQNARNAEGRLSPVAQAKHSIKKYTNVGGRTVRVPNFATGARARIPGLQTSANPTGARGGQRTQMRKNPNPSEQRKRNVSGFMKAASFASERGDHKNATKFGLMAAKATGKMRFRKK